ncbi:hypothetical protein GQ53DRAFT_769189 [Thozetella sp. PMI_491]|nr:hypothetical protein GQ53DRAFT_769189 [Thozetella sp. PMI_491]
MGYNTAATEWPTGVYVPSAVKLLVDKFLGLLDDDSPDVGDALVEIFSPNGVAYFGGQPFKGASALRQSRIHAWTAIATRRHEVLRVYAADEAASDLLFIGNVAMGLRNGKSVKGEFVGRITILNPESEHPLIQLYQVWGHCKADSPVYGHSTIVS